MRKLYLAAALAAPLALGACNNATQGVNNEIDAATISLKDAEVLALVYTSLPRCPVQAPLCSDPARVAQIKALDNKADAALQTARQNSALIGLAITAIGDFRAAIPAK